MTDKLKVQVRVFDKNGGWELFTDIDEWEVDVSNGIIYMRRGDVYFGVNADEWSKYVVKPMEVEG